MRALAAKNTGTTHLPSVSGYSSPSCSKSTTPSFESKLSSSHCLMTIASLLVKSAACCRTLALLLLRRQRMVETIWVR